MTTDYIYNPVVRETWFDKLTNTLSDTFYGSFLGQFLVQLAFFMIGAGIVGAAIKAGFMLAAAA